MHFCGLLIGALALGRAVAVASADVEETSAVAAAPKSASGANESKRLQQLSSRPVVKVYLTTRTPQFGFVTGKCFSGKEDDECYTKEGTSEAEWNVTKTSNGFQLQHVQSRSYLTCVEKEDKTVDFVLGSLRKACFFNVSNEEAFFRPSVLARSTFPLGKHHRKPHHWNPPARSKHDVTISYWPKGPGMYIGHFLTKAFFWTSAFDRVIARRDPTPIAFSVLLVPSR